MPSARISACVGIGLWALACSSEPAPSPATQSAPAPALRPVAPLRGRPPAPAPLVPLSWRADGAPSVLQSAAPRQPPSGIQRPEPAARAHLGAVVRHFAAKSLEPPEMVLRAQHQHRRRGAHFFQFEQHYQGRPVLLTRTTLLLDSGLGLRAVFGGPRPLSERPSAFAWTATDALARGLGLSLGQTAATSGLRSLGRDGGGFERFSRAGATGQPAPSSLPSGASSEILRVRQVYLPLDSSSSEPGGLLPAFELELVTGSGGNRRAIWLLLSGIDGAVLQQRNLLVSAHSYRVWADPAGTLDPFDSPLQTVAPHPTGAWDGFSPAPLGRNLVTVEGLNRNPAGGADPWLPPGATTTAGNNVIAFANLDGQDGLSSSDVAASVTSPGVFDHFFNSQADPLVGADQTQAAIVQLFYTTNWLHDWYYDSGFDESLGNAQVDNFSRGGAAGDPLIAEALHDALAGAANNASLIPLADGASPIMQIYLWSAPRIQSLIVDPGGALGVGPASFGPTDYSLTAPVAFADDGSADPRDACDGSLGDLTDTIVLIGRGGCSFTAQVLVAQAAGAMGVLIVNDTPGAPVQPSGSAGGIVIPTLGISLEDGQRLEAALALGGVSATMSSGLTARRAGSLDGALVSHEWGHHLHNRLAHPSTPQGDAMGEGWGDFVALHMLLGQGEDPGRAFSLGSYAARALTPDTYFGVRRMPYSTSLSVNPLTFRHIQDGEPLPVDVPLLDAGAPNSEIHNAGEIWGVMLLEAYAAVIEETTRQGGSFADARRAMSDYVVLGLLLHPAAATFTEARDALLSAAAALDEDHARVMAAAFARRGAGSCATAPARDSVDFVGVSEDFSLAPHVVVQEVRAVDLAACSWDDDARLDRGETGVVQVMLQNLGFGDAAEVRVALDPSAWSGLASVTGPIEQTVQVPAQQGAQVDFPLELSAAVADRTELPLALTVQAVGACEPDPVASTGAVWVNVDERVGSIEDFEASETTFRPAGALAELVWRREEITEPYDHQFQGLNLPQVSDTFLVSPPLEISLTETFRMTFQHRYSFEQSFGQTWDGGVVEVSLDGGQTWQDALSSGATSGPAYGGQISSQAQNPLGGRDAYVGTSDGYPAELSETIDWGTALAGQTAMVRFRIGTDEVTGGEGWWIDDVAVSGVTQPPFFALVSQDLSILPSEPCSASGGSASASGGAAAGGESAGGESAGGTQSSGGAAAGGAAAGGSASGEAGAAGDAAGASANAGGSGPGGSPASGGKTAIANGGSAAGRETGGAAASGAAPAEAGAAGDSAGGDGPELDATAGGCGCVVAGRTPQPSRHAPLLGVLGVWVLAWSRRKHAVYQPKGDSPLFW